jgi:ADP-heptose:LPS heptosyltransferase
LIQYYIQILNKVLFIFRWICFKNKKNPQKILIVRTGSLGDSICAIPAISIIRKSYPRAGISILSNTGKSNLISFKNLLKYNEYQFIDFTEIKKKDLIKKLNQERFDLVIDLVQNTTSFSRLFRNMLFYRFIVGIKSGFGWQISTLPYFRKSQTNKLSERQALIRNIKPFLNANTEFIYDYNIREKDVAHVKDMMKNIPRRYFVIVVGSKREMNRWPVEHFEKVVQWFGKEYFIVIGGKEDESIAKDLLVNPNVFSLCGDLTPIQSGLVMKNAILSLTNDTGPMHLAYSFGGVVFALFSNRDYPNIWFPPDDGKNKVFRSKNIDCELCLSEKCYSNFKCMLRIDPKDVIGEMELFLDEFQHL